MSTDPAGAGKSPAFDLDAPWRLHPRAAIRPERFGALLYHFGTRRLSFLKNRTLLDVVRALDQEISARSACLTAGVSEQDLPLFARALDGLAASDMICPRSEGRSPA
ncbi:mycofactocin biosynthesis chaperone MftB [Streptomyces sp. NPDC088921]|uniref:mycofactocin biosynthesis chaperone MftB n=1 Tax=unclassified Streptomyces TaxID=2593676 RepID=UPI003423D3C4